MCIAIICEIARPIDVRHISVLKLRYEKHAAQYVCCCLARRSGVLFELNTDVFIHSTKEKQTKLFIIMVVLVVVVVTYDHL